MKFDKQFSDEGVSPVVGVILMVAITVILSAIIATFVLDLGGTVSQNPQAGVTFDQGVSADQWDSGGDGSNEEDGYTVAVQIVSMENADSVTATYQNDGSSEAQWDDDNDDTTATVDYKPSDTEQTASSVGTTMTFDHLTDGDTISVTATLEGKTSVIQTYTVDG